MITYLLLVTSSLKIFGYSITESGIVSFLSFFLMMISELIFSIFVTYVLGADGTDMQVSYSRNLLIDAAVSSIQCFILSFDIIKTNLQKLAIKINNSNGNMLIKIMNNYSGGVDMHKKKKKGYTTKANGHGYGLAIASKIVNDEDAITNRISINGDTFCQEIKIKL